MPGRGDGGATSVRRDLASIGRQFGTDKVAHGYLPFYESLLGDADVRAIFELGVGGFDRQDDPAWGGNSLRMWKAAYPHAEVVSVDLLDKSRVVEDRIAVYRGSQVDEVLLAEVVAKHGPFDLIVDDASHIPDLTVRTFDILLPAVRDGGWYVIEDVSTSYWPRWGGRFGFFRDGATMRLVKRRLDGLNFAEVRRPGFVPSWQDRRIVEVRAAHDCVAFRVGANDTPGLIGPVEHPIPVLRWLRDEGIPTVVFWTRNDRTIRLLDRLRLRSAAAAVRRRLPSAGDG